MYKGIVKERATGKEIISTLIDTDDQIEAKKELSNRCRRFVGDPLTYEARVQRVLEFKHLKAIMQERTIRFQGTHTSVDVTDTLANLFVHQILSLEYAVAATTNGSLIAGWTAEIEMYKELLRGTIFEEDI